MHEYIQKIVDELERDYEPSEWVESILKEMQNIAIRETDAKWQAKLEELQKQLNEYMFVAETIDEMYVKEVQKSDELQKRVDKAIRLLVEAELYQSEPNIDLAVKALKGEGQ